MSDVEAPREQLPTRAVDRPDVPRTARRVDRPDPRRCTSTSRPPLPRSCTPLPALHADLAPPVLHGAGHRCCTASPRLAGAARRSRRPAPATSTAAPRRRLGRPPRRPGGSHGGRPPVRPRGGPGRRLQPPADRGPPGATTAAWSGPWTPSGRPYWALNGIDYSFTSIWRSSGSAGTSRQCPNVPTSQPSTWDRVPTPWCPTSQPPHVPTRGGWDAV